MLRSLLISFLGAFLLATSLSAQYDLSWEIECNLGEPKLHAIPRAFDPLDPRSPILSYWTVAYSIAELENTTDSVLPLALLGKIQPTRDGEDAGRPRFFLPATGNALDVVRQVEGDAKILDWYDLPAEIAPGESLKAACVLHVQTVSAIGSGSDPGPLNFPGSSEVQLQGLRSDVASAGGEVVVSQKVRVHDLTFEDRSFELGSGRWEDASSQMAVAAAAEQWSREMETDTLDAWRFDVDVQRPRPVLVTFPAQSNHDMRSVDERTEVFWYVRFRVANRTGKPRPFNLSVDVRTRRVQNDRLLEQLQDPNTAEKKKEFLRNVIGERRHLPILSDDAFRAAAAQEVQRYGAIFGPVSYFDLPPVIDVAEDSVEGALTALRTAPTGTFDVIVVFTDSLDPETVEFEVRIGGVQNEVDWLQPGTEDPKGEFANRKLYQVFEDLAVRFRRFGNVEILRDRFQFHDRQWKRRSLTAGELGPVDLSSAVTGKKD